MTTQPEALRLADWLDVRACGGDNWNAKMNAAAAELRRLHTLNGELLEALKEMLEMWEEDPAYGATHADKARAAIARAEGQA
jgi:hypothetical protein